MYLKISLTKYKLEFSCIAKEFYLPGNYTFQEETIVKTVKFLLKINAISTKRYNLATNTSPMVLGYRKERHTIIIYKNYTANNCLPT